MTSWIRRHPLVCFFVLAYLIAWVGVACYAAGLLPEPLFLPCGPLVAALVVIGVTEGRPGYRTLLSRMTRWRVGWVWWAAALGTRCPGCRLTGHPSRPAWCWACWWQAGTLRWW